MDSRAHLKHETIQNVRLQPSPPLYFLRMKHFGKFKVLILLEERVFLHHRNIYVTAGEKNAMRCIIFAVVANEACGPFVDGKAVYIVF